MQSLYYLVVATEITFLKSDGLNLMACTQMFDAILKLIIIFGRFNIGGVETNRQL